MVLPVDGDSPSVAGAATGAVDAAERRFCSLVGCSIDDSISSVAWPSVAFFEVLFGRILAEDSFPASSFDWIELFVAARVLLVVRAAAGCGCGLFAVRVRFAGIVRNARLAFQ